MSLMYSALYAQKTLQYANSMQSGKERNLLINLSKVQSVCLMSPNNTLVPQTNQSLVKGDVAHVGNEDSKLLDQSLVSFWFIFGLNLCFLFSQYVYFISLDHLLCSDLQHRFALDIRKQFVQCGKKITNEVIKSTGENIRLLHFKINPS